MTRQRSLITATALIGAITLLLASCATPPTDTPAGAGTSAPAPTSPAPTPEVTETAAPLPDPTCETIISPSVIEDFTSVGWTVRVDPFRVGEMELSDGVKCVWGDYTIATDHVQIYGWAPITVDETRQAERELLALGWKREDSPNGIIITESPDTAMSTDAEGYGLTYLFGDGWVKHADTKQGLLLVNFPQP